MPVRSVMLIEQGGRGGVADYTAALAAALAADGLQVELATAYDHQLGTVAGVRLRPVFAYLRGGTPLRDALRRARLHKVFNAVAYLSGMARLVPAARRGGLVHVQGLDLPPLVVPAFALLRLAGVRIVHTPHNTFERGRLSWARSRRLLGQLTDRLVVHAEADLPALPDDVRAKAVVIPHGEYGGLVEEGGGPVPRAAARAGLGLPDDAPVVLVFGQLRRDKGVEDVLTAALEVDGLHVVLAGEDLGALDLAADLLADPRLAGRVHVHAGFQPMDAAARHFSAADAVVLAYPQASASGVLLLAYGFERPVVAYPTGGLVEAIVDGQTGWIAASPDPAALADTLRAVADAGPEEAARRGRAGQALAHERFSWSGVAAKTRALYDAIRA